MPHLVRKPRLRSKSEPILQLLVNHLVRMLLGLHSRILNSLYFNIQTEFASDRRHHLRDLHHTEHVGYLIHHIVLAGIRRSRNQSRNALHRISQSNVSTRLIAAAINRQRHANGCLRHKPIDHRSPPLIDVKPSIQIGVRLQLLRPVPVNHSLHHVIAAQPPVLAGLIHTECALHFAHVIETHRVAGSQFATKTPFLPLILQYGITGEQTFEKRSPGQRTAIFTHRAQFDDRCFRSMVANPEQQPQSAHHVVLDGVDRLVHVRHAVRSTGDFGKLHDRFRLNLTDIRKQCIAIQQIHFAEFNIHTQMPASSFNAFLHRADLSHGLSSAFRYQFSSQHIVNAVDFTAQLRQLQSQRPAEISVHSQDQHLHAVQHVATVRFLPLAAGFKGDGQRIEVADFRTPSAFDNQLTFRSPSKSRLPAGAKIDMPLEFHRRTTPARLTGIMTR